MRMRTYRALDPHLTLRWTRSITARWTHSITAVITVRRTEHRSPHPHPASRAARAQVGRKAKPWYRAPRAVAAVRVAVDLVFRLGISNW